MTWLATSPYGPLGAASWQCTECPARNPGDPLTAGPDAIRDEARAHTETAGHVVTIARGTLETLYPMATAPDGGSDG